MVALFFLLIYISARGGKNVFTTTRREEKGRDNYGSLITWEGDNKKKKFGSTWELLRVANVVLN